MLKLIGSAPALSANVVATNLSISPAAATTALQAAHTAVRDIDDARAVRVSNINADLPYAQWLTLNLLGGLLMSSFLLLDPACAPFFLFLSLSAACCSRHTHALALTISPSRFCLYTGAPKLEATLFGLLAATSIIFYFVIEDLGDPFEGNWSVEPAAIEVASLQKKIQEVERRVTAQLGSSMKNMLALEEELCSAGAARSSGSRACLGFCWLLHVSWLSFRALTKSFTLTQPNPTRLARPLQRAAVRRSATPRQIPTHGQISLSRGAPPAAIASASARHPSAPILGLPPR